MIAPLLTRLEAQVSGLTGRLKGAAEFAALMRSNALREARACVYVLPLGLRGGTPNAAAGAFVQPLDESVAVVLVQPSHDPEGIRALGQIDELAEGVIEALAGWRPEGATGALRLLRAGMLNVGAGVLVYQIEFAFSRHLRINPR